MNTDNTHYRYSIFVLIHSLRNKLTLLRCIIAILYITVYSDLIITLPGFIITHRQAIYTPGHRVQNYILCPEDRFSVALLPSLFVALFPLPLPAQFDADPVGGVLEKFPHEVPRTLRQNKCAP